MKSLGYLPRSLSSKLVSDLERAGYQAFAALDVSEVLDLWENQDIDAVVIGAEVVGADVIEDPDAADYDKT